MRQFFLLLTPLFLYGQIDRITGEAFATRSEVIASHGAAATSQPLATGIALDILKKGGSAVDAAIAANAALGLMEPTGCGVGGDLFALVWDPKTQRLFGYNGSGRSPKGLSLAQLKAELAKQGLNEIPPYGFLPISVPGAVDGWFALHQKFGKLPMDQVLAPAISYAEEGFPVSELIGYYWAIGLRLHQQRPGAFGATFSINGTAPIKGQIFRNPDLAATYRQLAKSGREVFYRGEIAKQIDQFFKANGGYLAYRDLAEHKGEWVDPISVNYRGYEVYELPPNGQGLAVLQMLNILEGFDLKSWGPDSALTLHTLIEAKKLAFEDRARYYADPAFCQLPIQQLLSKSYAAERRSLIGDRASHRLDAGHFPLQTGDTIFLTTADQDGMMVALIQSNYRGMGSGIVVPGLGFCFQDRGQLFHLDPQHANVYAPGKRPFHTIIPAFVLKDGKPWLSFGVMGGDMQPQGHVQILVNLIDFGMNLQEAGDHARWQHLGSSDPTGSVMTDGGFVELERGIPWSVRRELIRRGHAIRDGLGGFGGYQAILFNSEQKVYYAASESRKDGMAAGY
ncbi:MAG: gamma-glutamyltransferase family protein [Acidobacteria bacterium]|nr:gamma-glutamyltransferase family protein [Acidobacteriota bacterium]MCB9397261.1 gamma-glutamyltransferase family protein [Acidobacteriota bacterium]